MSRALMQTALAGSIVLGSISVACHRNAPAQRGVDVGPVVKDTVHATIRDTNVAVFFEDTAPTSIFSARGQTFKLQTSAERQSLRATIRKERELWRSSKPRDYKFLLRVGCFCPGTRGWLLIEVRSGQPLRAWDQTGRSVALTDWNTISIDGVYDNLERLVDRDFEVRIAFDPRWHFPTYISGSGARMPDTWSITEARALRPLQ